jgi:hypothetical protein
MRAVVRRFLVYSVVLLAGCSTQPSSTQTVVPTAIAPCAADNTMSPQELEAVADLQRSVQSAPLYATSAAHADVETCHVGYASGVITMEYRFRDGSSLRVKRDSRIEYNDQQARIASPLAEDPVTILTRAEQTAFGANGCGIDWKQSETQPTEDDPNASDTVFRGDVCNCQARVRKDRSGIVVGLALRSTC